MCIAIYKPADKVLSDETLKNCFDNNNDGAGFAYINKDNLGVKRIIIKKTMEFDVFLRQYKRAIEVSPESPFLVHFRIKTHGEISTFNNHPFSIDANTAFIHNGIIKGVGSDTKKSDTQLFNEEILQKLPEGWLDNEGILTMMSTFIDYSKLVIMDINGEVSIINEGKGTWKDGVWFSNTSYNARTYTTHTYHNTSSCYNRSNTITNSHSTIGNRYLTIGGARKYSGKSLVQCDGCSKTYQALDTMDIYYQVGTCSVFCKACSAKLNVNEEGSFGDKINADCFIAWMSELKSDEFDNEATSFWTWNNPWTSQGQAAFKTQEEMLEQAKTFEESEAEYYDHLANNHSGAF